MVIAHNPDTTFDYVLEVDRQAETEGVPVDWVPTTWKLRPLREGEMAVVLDGGSGQGMGAAALSSLTVQMGLVGVSGLRDENGEDVILIRVPNGRAPRSFMDRLNWRWVAELAKEVCRISGLDVSDVEKPEPSPTD